MLRIPRLAATASAALALALLASGPVSAHEPTVSDPRIVAHFDFTAGQTPENIALAPDGSAYLTFAVARQIARVTPQGEITDTVDLPDVQNPSTPVIGFDAASGIVRAKDGTLYVNYATGTAETGVWRIRPDGSAPEQIAQLPTNGFPNGLALDEECGVLYAADSVLGTVWRIPQEGGTPTAWATGTELRPLPAPDGFVGANGIKAHKGAVWVSNTDRQTLLRIPVRHHDGTAGPVETRATGLASIDDFTFTGHGDTVLAALVLRNELALVRPDGTHKVLLTAQDGLSSPTSAAIRKDTLYVPSAAFFTQTDPNLLLARIDTKHK